MPERAAFRRAMDRAAVPVLLSLLVAAAAEAQPTWTATSLTNAPAARIAPAAWTGSRMIVWGGWASGFLNSGGIYDPATNTWTATSTTDAPAARSGHTAVWTGSKMIVWGGSQGGVYMNTGGVFDPATGIWTATSTTNAPPGRFDHTAVWTGSRMIVWGGGMGAAGYTNTGGIYDPVSDTWTAMSTTDAPVGRVAHEAVWTGSMMIVWGGQETLTYQYANTGGIYDPATDTWASTRTSDAPAARAGHTAVWSGSRMIIWGGWDGVSTDFDTGGLYDPVTDTWTATGMTGVPVARSGHSAVWTGAKMVVWGGDTSTGGIYDPGTDAWTPTSVGGAPAARSSHAGVWTGSTMVVWGGYYGSVLNTGGVYADPALVPPPADFYTLTPCRVVDTRNPDGATGGPILDAGATRSFPLIGPPCGIPATALAVSVNMTAVGPATSGNLVLFPGDAGGPPLASSLNFTAGVTRGNNAVVPVATDGSGTIKAKNRSAGTLHFVLDVNGYFQPPF